MLSLLVLYSCLQPTQFQSEISPRFGKDLYITEIYKRTIFISQCSFFSKEELVCVAMSVFIRTNFEPALFSFPAHIRPLSGLSQWLTITFAS